MGFVIDVMAFDGVDDDGGDGVESILRVTICWFGGGSFMLARGNHSFSPVRLTIIRLSYIYKVN